MRRKFLLIAGLLISAAAATVHAHPGRTAADGCHSCKTNCEKWGVPTGRRHCHGGSGLQADIDDVIRENSAPQTLELPHSHDGVAQEHTHGENGVALPNK